MADTNPEAGSKAPVTVVLVATVALTLGAPLVWSFAFSGLGALTWLIAAFGWLRPDWFVLNLGLLGIVAAVITAPVMAWVLYRILPQVLKVERQLSLQRSFLPNLPHAGASKTSTPR
jgi:hypothetical protein